MPTKVHLVKAMVFPVVILSIGGGGMDRTWQAGVGSEGREVSGKPPGLLPGDNVATSAILPEREPWSKKS